MQKQQRTHHAPARRASRTAPVRAAHNPRRAPVRPAHSRRRAPKRPASAAPAPIAKKAIIAALAVLAILAVVTLIPRAEPQPAQQQSDQSTYVSPYDWYDGLSMSGGHLTYSENGTQKSLFGIDVSDHQGWIDWDAVAADGVQFAFVRVGNRGYTEGTINLDTRFNDNLDGAEAAGIPVGVYFFSQATNADEAREEADFVVSQLGGRALQLPIVFDHEPVVDSSGRANNVDRQTLTEAAVAFCQRVQSDGYTAMVYGNSGDIARYDRNTITSYPIWYAEYGAPVPSAMFDFAIWQYSNTGTIDGISVPVDLNLLMTDAIQIR